MDYSDTLRWLQGLLGTAQSTYAQQFGQGLTAQQQALADVLGNQRTMQTAQLGEGGRQFDAALALQKVMADWQNQLALKDYGLKSEAQKAALAQQQWQNDWRNTQTMANASNPNRWQQVRSYIDEQNAGSTYNPTLEKFNMMYNNALGLGGYGGLLNLGLKFNQPKTVTANRFPT